MNLPPPLTAIPTEDAPLSEWLRPLSATINQAPNAGIIKMALVGKTANQIGDYAGIVSSSVAARLRSLGVYEEWKLARAGK